MATPLEDVDVGQLKSELDSLKRHLRIVSHQKKSIPLSITAFKLDEPNYQLSEPFYSHPCGYRLCLRAELTGSVESPGFVVHTCLMQGQFDGELEWPVKARITIEIRNQNGDSDHIQRSKQVAWQYKSLGDPLPIPVMTDVDLNLLKQQNPARYVVKGALQFTVKYMALNA
jgi:hypothetical protein